MERMSLLVLGAVVVGAICTIAVTTATLPPDVAMHFGWSGRPDSWSARDAYEALMIGQVVLEPLLVVGMMAVLPRRAPRLLQIPGRDHWLAPARRASTYGRLTAYASALGCVVVAYLTALHLAVVRANTAPATSLPMEPFLVMTIAFVLAVVLWAARLHTAFRVER